MSIVKRFDSLGDYCAAALQVDDYYAGRNSWAGGKHTMQETVDAIIRGASDSECRRARELLEKVDSSFRDREVMQNLPTVAGAYAVVPEYLMGIPENMRLRAPVEDDAAPVRIYMEVVVSGGVSHEEMTMRGAAMAALVTRMGEERAVELWGWSASHYSRGQNVLLAFRMDTRPVSLSHVVAAFADVAMARRITGALVKHYGGGGSGWLWAFGNPGDGRRARQVRELLHTEPQDVVIEGGYLPDASMMRTDPVGWVHKQLEKQRAVD